MFSRGQRVIGCQPGFLQIASGSANGSCHIMHEQDSEADFCRGLLHEPSQLRYTLCRYVPRNPDVSLPSRSSPYVLTRLVESSGQLLLVHALGLHKPHEFLQSSEDILADVARHEHAHDVIADGESTLVDPDA